MVKQAKLATTHSHHFRLNLSVAPFIHSLSWATSSTFKFQRVLSSKRQASSLETFNWYGRTLHCVSSPTGGPSLLSIDLSIECYRGTLRPLSLSRTLRFTAATLPLTLIPDVVAIRFTYRPCFDLLDSIIWVLYWFPRWMFVYSHLQGSRTYEF